MPCLTESVRTLTYPPCVPTGETHLLRPSEVMDLLRCSRTALHEWSERGDLTYIRLPQRPGSPRKGVRRYPADQPMLSAALRAVRGRR
jgi:hypothetical protein